MSHNSKKNSHITEIIVKIRRKKSEMGENVKIMRNQRLNSDF